MARSFREQRFARIGNSFVEKGAFELADYMLTPPRHVLAKTGLMTYTPSLLKRHHSIPEFIPSELAEMQQQRVMWAIQQHQKQEKAVVKSEVASPSSATSTKASSDNGLAAEPQRSRLPRLLGSASSRTPQEGSLGGVAAAEKINADKPKAESRLAEQRPSSSALSPASNGGGVTTFMIQNLPDSITQPIFLEALDSTGFEGRYDFCYCPADFKTRICKGFAFVNFMSPADASEFKLAWQSKRPFGKRHSEGKAPLNVKAAATQGLEANLQSLDLPRKKRIRCPALRPFVRGE